MGWNFDRFFLCFLIEFGAIAFFFKKKRKGRFQEGRTKSTQLFYARKAWKNGWNVSSFRSWKAKTAGEAGF